MLKSARLNTGFRDSGLLATVVASLFAVTVFGSDCATNAVDVSGGSFHWQEVRERIRTVAWAYPSGATSARLTIRNIRGVACVDTSFESPVTSYAWEVFPGVQPEADDFFTLVIDFGTVAQTGTVALVKAHFTGSTALKCASADEWNEIAGPVLIPCSADWTEAEASACVAQSRATGYSESWPMGGREQWFGWNVAERGKWRYGWFDLSFGTGESALTAELYRQAPGFLLLLK